ncbi:MULTISPECIES: FecCD family ABC transporter permease [Micrococcales]|uniref:ABC-type Fe3+-siderophore transport system, permease component n=1 Tax=Agrococcus casei LMG 22410 TaxID=1255656 RepID=A0A1R4EQ14_9MICO|nr:MULTISPECIES: iron ABC transporter permease [Micrococcales]SJM45636.1 ABC-type Fe3+-siderophore transport system, permease component [Agrococcus casei LMG 22410]
MRGDRVTGRVAVLVLGILLMGATAAASLFVGAGHVAPQDVVDALLGGGDAESVTIVREMRLPRTINALLVGAALGFAGAIMQALIGNPLADPGLLGVNAGAGLAVMIAVGAIGLTSFNAYIGFALAGALLVSLFVYAVSLTVGRGSPFTIVLAGVAVTAVLTGVSTALAVLDSARFNALRGWMSGDVAGRDLEVIGQGAIVIGVGLVVAMTVTRPLAQLALGADTARGLGVAVGRTRLGAAIAVMLLAGGATALGGPIVFIGLMVPHLARALVGPRLSWALAYSALAGGLLLLVADMIGRVVIPPGEAPAGLLTAIIGAPVLAMLVRGSAGRAKEEQR